jgi:hypothetical protein
MLNYQRGHLGVFWGDLQEHRLRLRRENCFKNRHFINGIQGFSSVSISLATAMQRSNFRVFPGDLGWLGKNELLRITSPAWSWWWHWTLSTFNQMFLWLNDVSWAFLAMNASCDLQGSVVLWLRPKYHCLGFVKNLPKYPTIASWMTWRNINLIVELHSYHFETNTISLNLDASGSLTMSGPDPRLTSFGIPATAYSISPCWLPVALTSSVQTFGILEKLGMWS